MLLIVINEMYLSLVHDTIKLKRKYSEVLHGDRKENIMEIILSELFILGIFSWFKLQDGRSSNYLNTHVGKIDYGKMNEDRILNDLSNSQVNQNILSGKYDKR